MDVGCGTGILSMFAAKAGAKKVVAVDQSNIIEKARLHAKENNFENQISFIQGKVELIENLQGVGVEKVDIIISEWMGYCLLFECMLPSVIVARDRFAAPGGRVFPDVAEMFIGAWSSTKFIQDKINYWDDVYGFSMKAMKEQIWQEPQVETLKQSDIITNVTLLKAFDINVVKINDLDFSAPFELHINQTQEMHGFVVYFDIEFKDACIKTIKFSTGPFSKQTHWGQTLFMLPQALKVEEGNTIKGIFDCRRRQHHRDLSLALKFQVLGKTEMVTLSYLLL